MYSEIQKQLWRSCPNGGCESAQTVTLQSGIRYFLDWQLFGLDPVPARALPPIRN